MKNIILNEFKNFLRNPYLVGFLIIFPTILVYIMGSFLEQVQTADETITSIHLGYYINEEKKDDKQYQEAMQVKGLLEETEKNLEGENILFEVLSSKEEAARLLEKGKLDAYLIYEQGKLKLYEGTKVYLNHTIKCIVNNMMGQIKAYEVVMEQGIGKGNQLEETISHQEVQSYTVSKKLASKMSMIDYYAIAMMIMTCFFGSLGACMAFTEERNSRTINRLITLPYNRFKIFAGKVIGLMPQAILQASVIMLVSTFIFGATYASDFSGNLLLFVAFTLTGIVVSAIGVLLSLIFKKSVVVPLFIVSWIMLFYSGNFAIGMAIKPFCNYLPPYQINQAVLDLTLFGKTEGIWWMIMIEMLIIMMVLVLGGIIFSKKQEERG